MKVRYAGPHAQVDVVDVASGYMRFDVALGDVLDVPDALGARLVEQDVWEAVSTRARRDARDALADDERDGA